MGWDFGHGLALAHKYVEKQIASAARFGPVAYAREFFWSPVLAGALPTKARAASEGWWSLAGSNR
jgi:hypothetical protein